MAKTFLVIAVAGIAVAAVALSLWEVGVGIEEDTIERRLVAAAALDGVVGGRLASTLIRRRSEALLVEGGSPAAGNASSAVWAVKASPHYRPARVGLRQAPPGPRRVRVAPSATLLTRPRENHEAQS